MKMTATDQIKFLDRKIMQNEARYDLDRKAARISALSFNDMDKYKYLTGKNLGLKPSTVEQAKFEYFPLDKVFSKGLDEEEDKKEGLLKRPKNIEDKNEELLKTTKNKTKNIEEIANFIKEPLSPEAEDLMLDYRDVDYRELTFTVVNKNTFDFSDFKTFNDLSRDLYFKKMTIDDAEKKQNEFNKTLGDLSDHTPKNKKYIEARENLLDNAKNIYEGGE